jgi:surface antigen
MSSFDHRQRSVTDRLQLPGLVSELSPVEQLPFPETTSSHSRTTRRLEFDSSPNVTETLEDAMVSPGRTRNLPEYTTSPGVTRILPDVNTGPLSFSPIGSTTTALRQPVVIPGTGKKSPGLIRPPKGRKWVISISAIILLTMITFGTAFAVSPLQGESGRFTSPIQLVANLVHNSNNNPSLISQQATATAIHRQDGYDPVSGVSTQPVAGGGGLNRFAFGQCTYWANMRYHQLTGYWVPWLGNAYEWAYGAKASGWIVSSKPIVPSIIVLQPGVQGAGYFGHVAVVERINSDGSVYTSNYNWYANGGWDILSYVTFTPGPGVVFTWHP